jgi:hypothetical protein
MIVVEHAADCGTPSTLLADTEKGILTIVIVFHEDDGSTAASFWSS